MKLLKTGQKKLPEKPESDRQMLIRICKKFAILMFVISMFDTLIDWFLSLMDVVIHLIHLLIEAIEYSFIVFFEHTLHLNHYQSEIIIVNGAIIIALYLAYRFIIAAPLLFVCFKRNLLAGWLRYARRRYFYWKALSICCRIKLVCAYGACTTCFFFFITL